jgi:hypothetical protein
MVPIRDSPRNNTKKTNPVMTNRYIQPTFTAVACSTARAVLSIVAGAIAAAITKITMIATETRKTAPTSPSIVVELTGRPIRFSFSMAFRH